MSKYVYTCPAPTVLLYHASLGKWLRLLTYISLYIIKFPSQLHWPYFSLLSSLVSVIQSCSWFLLVFIYFGFLNLWLWLQIMLFVLLWMVSYPFNPPTTTYTPFTLQILPHLSELIFTFSQISLNKIFLIILLCK